MGAGPFPGPTPLPSAFIHSFLLLFLAPIKISQVPSLAWELQERQSLTFYDQGDRLENADAQIPGEGKAAGGVGEFQGISSYLNVPVPVRGHESLLPMNQKRNHRLGPFSSCREKIRGCALGTSCQSLGTAHQSQEKAAHILGNRAGDVI